MSKLQDAMHAEIRRIARKEIRETMGSLGDDVRALRKDLRTLTRRLDKLEKVERPETRKRAVVKEQLLQPKATDRPTRLSGGLIRKLRKRLGISQSELADLLEVSASAVAAWEQDRVKPREETRQRIIALREATPAQVRETLQAI